MIRRAALLLLVASLVPAAACLPDGLVGVDRDAAAPFDQGAPVVDGGAPPPDLGAPPMDAGTAPDCGVACGVDAGASDAGPSDAATSCAPGSTTHAIATCDAPMRTSTDGWYFGETFDVTTLGVESPVSCDPGGADVPSAAIAFTLPMMEDVYIALGGGMGGYFALSPASECGTGIGELLCMPFGSRGATAQVTAVPRGDYILRATVPVCLVGGTLTMRVGAFVPTT